MRDCFFLVADTNMAETVKGFLGRKRFYESLGTAPFDFDPAGDLVVAAGDNDPGLFVRAHEILALYRRSHRRAVVIIDSAWDGSPGAEAIKREMTANLHKDGWDDEIFRVIVIDPELENWIWQKNVHVARALGFETHEAMVEAMSHDGNWPAGKDKPIDPKGLWERMLRRARIPRSSAIYRKITSQVSISRCRDEAFLELRQALQSWFPAVRR